jgi:serine/threonine-protein kinase
MALNPGDIVDHKYRIVRLLGEGGMGAVYEGENTRIHRRVAIKVLHSSVAGSADAVQRFEREAQAAGRIGSEHIVEVLDLGHLPDGDRYMVMEFLDGQSLSQRIESRGRLSAQVIAPIIVQLLEGLRAAHDAGIIHRDLKPDNVFLLANRSSQRDFVKILDFGISKFNTLGGEFSMTRTGAVMGTPYYMSPEQAKGNRDVDLRADLYAVGVILYEALAGEVPFSAETFNELLFKIVLESPAPLVDKVPDIDPTFAAIVDKAMARDPAQRYQTAEEMKAAIEGWLVGAPVLTDNTLTQGTPHGVVRSPMHTPAPAGAGTAGPEGARPVGQKTQGAWAASGEYAAEAPKKGPPKTALIAAAALAVLALGGGGYLAMSGADDSEEARAAAQAIEDAKAEAERKAEELRLEAEQARAEAERAKSERARLEAEANKSAAEKARLDAERLAAEKLAEEKEEAARQARVAASRPRPQPTQNAAPPREPPPPSTPSTPSTGRVIRTDL